MPAMRTWLILTMGSALALAQTKPDIPLENEWVRVVLATNAPGSKSKPHQHGVNRVMIHLDRGAMRLAFEGGPAKDVPFAAGAVRWDPAGGMHTSENTGGTAFRIVEVELKKPGGKVEWPAQDPRKVAPHTYHLEFENDQVRVLRVKLPAGGGIPQHHHVVPRVVVPLTEVSIEVTRTDGAKVYLKGKPGDALFGRPDVHREENQLAQPVELILVELKG
jgi:quercetin dioxygenase-like cupin family protein